MHAHTEYLKMIEVYSPLGIWPNRRIHLSVCLLARSKTIITPVSANLNLEK